jgi:adenylosuccinate synthase
MNTCVVGLQWGDEGKGKIVDILAEKADVVVRYSGGANAGHTVVIGDMKFALHLLPSGAVRPGTVCVIANGVVVDPDCLIGEIDALAQKGISLNGRLFISQNAHLVLDYHKAEDQLRENSLGKNKIGTTIRGIGPCYADKVGRTFAVRATDLADLDSLRQKLIKIVDYKNKIFSTLYNAEPHGSEQIFEKCKLYAEKLVPFITDTTRLLHKAIEQRKSILFEGAQGTLLDLDHGTFPFVTSSSASSLGMSAGAGVPARSVDKFIGVAKAYTTRVGAGPFPTELDNEIGSYIRDRGKEYGTTTGRPRRCGWFDAVAVRYSVTIGGIDAIALMHLDTLSGIEQLNICKAYRINSQDTTFFPSDIKTLAKAEPVYQAVRGWDDDLSAASSFDELPENAKNYVTLVEQFTAAPVTIIGVGPKRSQTIFR